MMRSTPNSKASPTSPAHAKSSGPWCGHWSRGGRGERPFDRNGVEARPRNGNDLFVTAESEWYANSENWAGSRFEVGIRLGVRDDIRLLRGLRSVWTSPLVDGPLSSPSGEPPPAVDEALLDNDPIPHLVGAIQISNHWVGCTVMGLRWESDWLCIAIPEGMLELIRPLHYPMHSEGNFWLHDVERVLADVADHVYRAVPFELAVLGEEATDITPGGDGIPLSRAAVEENGGYVLSEDAWQRLDLSKPGEILPTGLRWIPINLFAGRSV